MKVFIKTFGCTMNTFDSQVMEEQFRNKGHTVVADERDVDIVIVNTCIVKQPTENKVLKHLKSLKKPFVITGCFPVAYLDKLSSLFPNVSMVGTNSKDVVDVAERSLRGECVRFVRMDREKICDLTGTIKIIAVSEGCIGNCAYCAAKLARGRLRSYKPGFLADNARNAISSGAREIWLTSQDTGVYGTDIKSNLTKLLKKITSIKGKFFVRVGMMNPSGVDELMPELINCFKNEKVFKFLHLPVQSGSDDVLMDMNRSYRVDDFKHIISEFKKIIPDITISTDVICGFPTESKQDFNRTIKLVRWLKPDIINISRFWPRPGTAAAELKPLHGRITKERSRKVTKLSHKISLTKNKKWLGWRGEMLIDEEDMGRNYAYKPIVIDGDISEFLDVEIVGAKRHYLTGKRITK